MRGHETWGAANSDTVGRNVLHPERCSIVCQSEADLTTRMLPADRKGECLEDRSGKRCQNSFSVKGLRTTGGLHNEAANCAIE